MMIEYHPLLLLMRVPICTAVDSDFRVITHHLLFYFKLSAMRL